MRFTALLLLATLVGALVCAQDTTTNDIQAATAKSSLSPEFVITAPAESTSLQETATATQKTSGAAQAPTRVTLRRQGLNPLKSMIEKSFLLADKAFDGAEDKANERIQDGKQLAEGAADFIQKLRKILLDPRKFGFLSI
ncbi:extracellular glycoprotein lacritin isoform 1-T1 [Glossophaga mutica]